MFERIREDVRVVFERDPAAKNVLEVILCYPGLHALIGYRIAHFFYERKMFVIARLVSHVARFLTGIEIHPGARIGRRLFIDHGMGVVIGETAEVGDDVTIYQGVTLGGTGKEKGKRHPTVRNRVVIAAGAKVLGSFEVGDGAKIGAGAVVLRPVPAGATVVGVPGRIVARHGRRVPGIDLNHQNLPDPVQAALEAISQRVEALEERLESLEKASEPAV
ncbi:MAG: serine O-acetyltransferase [Firmicutes bacterium]|jgi:serine O-acetyltransferase|nr:serine O-acetyltransferase [Bacillota bacterium]MDH7496129.1 serine O-acetyltransferase [Bacillota bacterium]